LEPRLCLIMEFCSRGSVYDILVDTRVHFGWKELLGFAIQMVLGIQCLHNCDPQILHRDVKTMNFLVSENWTIKVCDFGLARTKVSSGMSTLKKLRGTLTHISPETCRGENFTTKSDIYSFGTCLWEMAYRCLNGSYESPFTEYDLESVQIVMRIPQGLRPTLPAKCPPLFGSLISACWDNDPANRPACEGVLERLRECERQLQSNRIEWESTEYSHCQQQQQQQQQESQQTQQPEQQQQQQQQGAAEEHTSHSSSNSIHSLDSLLNLPISSLENT